MICLPSNEHSLLSKHLKLSFGHHATKLTNYIKDDVTIETRTYNDQTIALFKSIIDTICWNDVYASEDPKKVILHF